MLMPSVRDVDHAEDRQKTDADAGKGHGKDRRRDRKERKPDQSLPRKCFLHRTNPSVYTGLFLNIQVMYFSLSENASRDRRFIPIFAASFLPPGQHKAGFVHTVSGPDAPDERGDNGFRMDLERPVASFVRGVRFCRRRKNRRKKRKMTCIFSRTVYNKRKDFFVYVEERSRLLPIRPIR